MRAITVNPPNTGVAVGNLNGGEIWLDVDLEPHTDHLWAAVPWAVRVDAEPGPLEILARATDTSGATLEPRWNTNGYANNVVHRVTITWERRSTTPFTERV